MFILRQPGRNGPKESIMYSILFRISFWRINIKCFWGDPSCSTCLGFCFMSFLFCLVETNNSITHLLHVQPPNVIIILFSYLLRLWQIRFSYYRGIQGSELLKDKEFLWKLATNGIKCAFHIDRTLHKVNYQFHSSLKKNNE